MQNVFQGCCRKEEINGFDFLFAIFFQPEFYKLLPIVFFISAIPISFYFLFTNTSIKFQIVSIDFKFTMVYFTVHNSLFSVGIVKLHGCRVLAFRSDNFKGLAVLISHYYFSLMQDKVFVQDHFVGVTTFNYECLMAVENKSCGFPGAQEYFKGVVKRHGV